MEILDGKAVAAFHREQIEQRLDDLHERQIHPELAIILAGSDKPSAMYAKSMCKVACSMGLKAEIYAEPGTVRENELIAMIEHFNEQPSIFGILMMMPLPSHMNANRVVNCIDPRKDVDGLTDKSIADLFTGRPGFVPCTPRAVISILDYYHVSLSGKEVVIVGRSNVVGKPLAQLCLNRNATVTHCHTRTRELSEVTRRADILISAAGRAKLIRRDMIKPGAVVIDVGINRWEGKTVGDVDFEEVKTVAGAITPVPGGVGAVTTMMIVENVVCGTKQTE
ncbi:MAG: bifunctional 5,10-methylene-tetrahydrofolate dehydrogenase/5,10-methylene-tetrahydrofolate cyclohydrolase [Megasphaera sp.]|jgi:methylenetetrahydrofolate dehydrogenase (NADP+)/methenyltetrahydrofolate cyclohydrolase|uniref:bifunctional 5,10-methylenetetrahydrofolate dehydrogenase/5,10-methenyltetrahydrofolate cyclohydrolase n=1 Tax=Megasphaera sueciensis TaxID=349094 RepID=UPI003D019B79|nr:bifunctional 5,10-methylene-tetrahydrofolate dehydrogenase/5,10-methylene-tetrahydrofolate cyclohydrolase [Megasphaera sp.]MCI1824090.1 bifunctional 5,10-methylene-tetrahydrofolate dehydrogenase/5,10-methylene-tetrahydrofolate cyclohydrolase [Megasphaera sp.]